MIAEGGGSPRERPLDLDVRRDRPPARTTASGHPATRCSRSCDGFDHHDRPSTSERREVERSPVTPQMAPAIGRRHRPGAVQGSSLLISDRDFVRLWRTCPAIPRREVAGVRVVRQIDPGPEFLGSSRRSFEVDRIYSGLASLDGLRHLPEDLDSVSIGATDRPLDLAIVSSRSGSLKDLKPKRPGTDLDVMSGPTTGQTSRCGGHRKFCRNSRCFRSVTGLLWTRPTSGSCGSARSPWLRRAPVGRIRYLEGSRGLADRERSGRRDPCRHLDTSSPRP